MSQTAVDTWVTETIEDIEYDNIKAKFRDSLVERAEKRKVSQLLNDTWVVAGDPSLGDAYSEYLVKLVNNRYICSCYTHFYGDVRSRRICSHVLAVILWRRRHKMPEIPSPQDSMFGFPPIPAKFKEFRPHQWRAVQEVVNELSKPGIKTVFLNAPTGSGKTLIAEAVRRLLRERALYLCTTKTLQDQFMSDFGEYAALLKGRSNYPTLDYPERFYYEDSYRLTAADCEKKKVPISCEEAECENPYCEGKHYKWVCPWCSDPMACPYEVAKRQALRADLAVLNTAYFLTEANGPGLFSGDSPYAHPFIIIDEADELEEELMRYIEISISARTRKKLGINTPAKKTVEESWAEWVEKEALPAIGKELMQVRFELKMHKDNPPVTLIRWKKHLENLEEALKNCDLKNGNWVYTGYKGESDEHPVIFRPIRVNEQAPELLWKHGEKFLLMSATIIDPEGMAEDLGLEPNSWAVVNVENTFPADRRPIYVIPRANMTHKNKDESYPKLKNAIDKILEAYPNDRVLIHTVSYDLARYLKENLNAQDRLLIYNSADERNKVLEQYKQTPGAVILAPSLDRGVDLKDDLCRVVIVAKIPFPNLGDRQVSARLHSKGGERWYRTQTIRTLVQMTGRGMRDKNDSCDIYILDIQFVDNIWKKSRSLLPEWWREAIVRDGSPKVRI